METQPLLAPPCWACWETSSSYYNPLVRVCRGCKDPELQWIHQQCIDRYINALPTPRRPLSPTEAESSNVDLNQYLSTGPVYYYCTRCRDPYNVVDNPLNPFQVIWNSKWLFYSMLLVTLSLLLLISSSLLLLQHDANDIAFEILGLQVPFVLIGICLLTFALVSGYFINKA